jgi:hypothetical protein
METSIPTRAIRSKKMAKEGLCVVSISWILWEPKRLALVAYANATAC